MLPRKDLIPLRREFARIRKTGKIYDSTSFGLIASYGGNSGPTAAFIVSKKIDKKSVVRHGVKRKLSDAVSPLLARLGKNTELVFLAKQKAVTTTAKDLATEVEQILRRERLLS